MLSPVEASYGSWTSPITAEMTANAEKINRGSDIVTDGTHVYWTENRTNEKGRTVILKYDEEGKPITITPPGFDIRTKVHEYGGRSFTVRGNTIYFVNRSDQKLYSQEASDTPKPITNGEIRLAEPLAVPQGIIAIAEKHHDNNVENYLALIDTTSGNVLPLHRGHDFYANPTLNRDGTKLAWITWDHPYMPWDATKLWTADFHQGQLSNIKQVAGHHKESILQPRWSPKGNLYYISDATGWWNLHNLNGVVWKSDHDFGRPLWMLGTSTWDFTGNDEEIFCSYNDNGRWLLTLFHPIVKEPQIVDLPYTDYTQIQVAHGFAYFIIGSPTTPRRIARLRLSNFQLHLLDHPETLNLDAKFLSIPQQITYPTTDGKKSYAYYYKAKNPNFIGPKNELPPLIVFSHGGPTAATDSNLNLRVQYWTSRGFSVLDVNYRGSTGFGRDYRDQLKGKWGIYDVDDCIEGARYLISKGEVNPKRLFIRGGSAGGFTTLAALTKTSIFSAGASYYGVSDLKLLVSDTHKFEAMYLESLIGPYKTHENLYVERSPIHNSAKIKTPIIFFQGGMDKVVPPNQTEVMYKALKEGGIKTEMVLYPEEEHGFRQLKNIEDSLERERQFYIQSPL